MALHEHGVQDTSNTNKTAVKKPAVIKKSNQLKFGNQIVQLSDKLKTIARRPVKNLPVDNIKAGNAEDRNK